MKIEKPNLSWNGNLTPLSKNDVEHIIVHHPAAVNYGLMDCHRLHRDTYGWIGIGYNYYMRKSGTAYEARGSHIGAHAQGYNDKSIGVCVEGNYDEEEMQDSTLNAYADLIKTLMDKYDVPASKVIRHRDVGQTACPGKNFPWQKFKSMIGGESSSSSTTTASSTSFTDLPAEEKYAEIKKAVDDVAVLQRQLKAVGEDLSRYGDDGKVGAETLAAIESFQSKHGISSPSGDFYGRPGPSTQDKLKEVLPSFDRVLRPNQPYPTGSDVDAIQRVVYPQGSGQYGPKTSQGVRDKQSELGIGVDGIFGPETRGAMFGL